MEGYRFRMPINLTDRRDNVVVEHHRAIQTSTSRICYCDDSFLMDEGACLLVRHVTSRFSPTTLREYNGGTVPSSVLCWSAIVGGSYDPAWLENVWEEAEPFGTALPPVFQTRAL